MKNGRTLMELVMEIDRQQKAKKDYLLDTRLMQMVDADGRIIMEMPTAESVTSSLSLNDIAHQQIGTHLSIPKKYYDRMMAEEPSLLATNVNTWFQKNPAKRMVRTLDGTARAFLSDRYRRIDNFQIAETVLPIIADIPDARVESCEITESKLYIKVINPRLEKEVAVGDAVQSGIMISNSEVGLGSVQIQPLVYRLVCSNGMVVNDASTRKKHVGRGNEADENYELFADETLIADDKAFMLKIRDTVRSVVDEVQFDKVIAMMRNAKAAKIETPKIPEFVELSAKEFNIGKNESESVLNYLIRGGDLSLYGLSNAVTRFSQDVKSYDRATELESIGYDILSMPKATWKSLNAVEAIVA